MTGQTVTTREQLWAQRAYLAIVAFEKRASKDSAKEYLSFARSFPALIHSCGLAQALAFAQAKATDKSCHDPFLNDLATVLNQGEPEELADKSRTCDLSEYLRLSRHTLTAAGWIKRYADALLKKKVEPDDTGD